MKHINKTRLLIGATFIIGGAIFFQGCKKEGADLELGAKPVVDFKVVEDTDPNNLILVSTSNVPVIPYWTVSTGFTPVGDSARVNFARAGQYTVKMKAYGMGGVDSITKTINIAQNDPNACLPTKAAGFIASCTQKTWKLNPAAGAYAVGPNAGDGSWWTSAASEVTTRPCEFNDTYTFNFATSVFAYDNKDDFYSDGYLGTVPSQGCQPSANLTGEQAFWKSNPNYRFEVLPGGTKGLGRLKLIGKGAHIGLQKAQTAGEINSGPAGTENIYDIMEMQINAGGSGHDILKLALFFGGGWWHFTLRSE
ncbi:hypothetical protein LZZ85_23320 [Terrimonas sp. NA20]|uniref:PKD domain-containing protein n=1 Tax=Terrimonas ginsenosidimutans TaxID=2908004 RepID=A0ABS9KY49_9BACT|nr:hypothetical protein [Terrimonas ginsenosidimutans]MCG2617246.1 hypothetical protein [Terrimonas ginsenosidimutans]